MQTGVIALRLTALSLSVQLGPNLQRTLSDALSDGPTWTGHIWSDVSNLDGTLEHPIVDGPGHVVRAFHLGVTPLPKACRIAHWNDERSDFDPDSARTTWTAASPSLGLQSVHHAAISKVKVQRPGGL
eukprot:2465484-Amphidinium_carterae.2